MNDTWQRIEAMSGPDKAPLALTITELETLVRSTAAQCFGCASCLETTVDPEQIIALVNRLHGTLLPRLKLLAEAMRECGP